jgi:hypothetical protein
MTSLLDAIPREHLIAMLKDAAWFTGGRKEFGCDGYSLDVSEETCLRDVLYRDEKVYPTAEEAIHAHWIRHYNPQPRDENE